MGLHESLSLLEELVIEGDEKGRIEVRMKDKLVEILVPDWNVYHCTVTGKWVQKKAPVEA